MLKPILIAIGLTTAMAGPAFVQTAFIQTAFAQTTMPTAAPTPSGEATPATPDDCIKVTFDLAQKAEDKKMSNDDLDKVEQLLAKMEGHCDAKQFQDAMAVSNDIKQFIASKN